MYDVYQARIANNDMVEAGFAILDRDPGVTSSVHVPAYLLALLMGTKGQATFTSLLISIPAYINPLLY